VAILGNKRVFTLKAWCDSNGYDGVTKECILSASGSENPKVVALAKKAKLTGIAKDIKGKKNVR